jgi:site-specific DNA recombinase
MKRRTKQPKAARRVIVYCRVSTDEQADKGISLDAQEAKGRGYIALHDLELVVVIRESASGKTLARDGLQEALKLLRNGAADSILVSKLDRLARKVSIWGELVDGYFEDDSPWSLLSVMDHVDTTTASGRLALNILMSVYQWERETIAERTRDALAHLSAQGVVLGGAPFGLNHEPPVVPGERRQVVEVPRELVVVRRIRQLRALGHTVREIAELLQEEDAPTKRGGRWHPTTVQRILRRQRVA